MKSHLVTCSIQFEFTSNPAHIAGWQFKGRGEERLAEVRRKAEEIGGTVTGVSFQFRDGEREE